MLNRSITISRLRAYLQRRYKHWIINRRVGQLASEVAEHARQDQTLPVVAIFNASTRISGLSLNAAFSLLTAWGLQLSGARVVHFVCKSGMTRCVLGTDRDNHQEPPPCRRCISQSEWLYDSSQVEGFSHAADRKLESALHSLPVEEMLQFEYDSAPYGSLVAPSLRWVLRRHHLVDDAPTRFLLRAYILSAHRVRMAFTNFLDQVHPEVVILFNGIMFPEATARWVAVNHGVRVVTHEVGFRPYSAFFTEGHATAYPIHIPETFELTPEQNARLDTYLENRFRGKFTMAGIRFWPQMQGLSDTFRSHAGQFKQVVAVFTNVVFDTSQVHANTVFSNMFAWLQQVLTIIHTNPDTLFVIRAHPDEMRAGKESRESVEAWVRTNQVDQLPNVIFIGPKEYFSSYELIQLAKFVLVYNSSIGLESTLLGSPVVCGGKARYTQYPMVTNPPTPETHQQQILTYLDADHIDIPSEFLRNARRFLYYQLFRTSLPFDKFLAPGLLPGFVQLRPFPWQDLLPERSAVLRVIVDGILNQGPFLLEDQQG